MHIASDSYVQNIFFCLERNGSVLSLERDHDYYYQAQQQIHTTGRDKLDFVLVVLKLKLIDMKAFAIMSSIVILKGKQDVRLAEKVKTINVVQQQQNGSVMQTSTALFSSLPVLRTLFQISIFQLSI